MKSSTLKYLLVICATAVSFQAWSAKLPDYYPETFDRTGIIDQLDLDRQIIVVNDKSIPVARDLKVYTANTRFATPRSLQRGMKVGFGTTGSRALSGAVQEIWVLPSDYTPSRSQDGPAQERRKDRD